MERMNDLIQTINENLNREINVAVKKATTQVVKSMNPNGGNMLDANEIKNMMSGKVDRDELTALYDLKSNKLDTEMTMKSVDIVHKQIKHLVVILVEIMRLSVTAQSETKQSKLNKKMYLLQQSISIGQWINEFDPENINTNDLKLPSELNVF